VAELHPQLAPLAEAAAMSGASTPAELEAMRDDYLDTAIRLGGALEPVDRVEDVVIARPDGAPALAARAYRPTAVEPVGALVWFHGGGWCIGDLDGFDRVCRSLCNASSATVVSVDYRLAPEHPYPAAVRDADLAVAWAKGHGAAQLGFDPGRIAVGGDSAGGNLAAAVALHARDTGGPAIDAQVLLYPMLVPPSTADPHSGDSPLLTRAETFWFWERYRPSGAYAAPGLATDLAGLPPAYVVVAGVDPLRDEALAFARGLSAARVPVHVSEYDEMVHGFLLCTRELVQAREAIDAIGKALWSTGR
jgi:acetyl esterase